MSEQKDAPEQAIVPINESFQGIPVRVVKFDNRFMIPAIDISGVHLPTRYQQEYYCAKENLTFFFVSCPGPWVRARILTLYKFLICRNFDHVPLLPASCNFSACHTLKYLSENIKILQKAGNQNIARVFPGKNVVLAFYCNC